jgi:hypothetical protein
MKRRAAIGIVFFLSILSLCVGQAMAAGPTDVHGNPIHTKGKFGLDVVVGPSVLLQEPMEGVSGKVAFTAGGSLLYSITDWFLVGVRGEWEMRHYDLDDEGIDLGKDSNITVLPFAQLRGPFSSYLYFGVGYNFNDLEDLEDVFGNKIDMDDTLALQGGGGWDAFVTKHLAINVELGIKYNKGGANLVQGARSTPLGDINLTAFVGTVGLRYFF